MGVSDMIIIDWFKKWWNDDWHRIPRYSRDLYFWLLGTQSSRVDLHTMTYDPETETVHDDITRVRRKDLPPGAVHRSGFGRSEYVLDLDNSGPWPKEGEATAGDLYLFAQTDAYDLNTIFKDRGGFGIDVRMLGYIVLGVVAIVGVWVVYKWIL